MSDAAIGKTEARRTEAVSCRNGLQPCEGCAEVLVAGRYCAACLELEQWLETRRRQAYALSAAPPARLSARRRRWRTSALLIAGSGAAAAGLVLIRCWPQLQQWLALVLRHVEAR
jgi:hypothetical protein